MILFCNFEELRAISAGAELLLSGESDASGGGVAAPPEAITEVERLQPRLTASLEIATLAEQKALRSALSLICETLHTRMEDKVLEYHPAHEEAVSLYFDYAHVFAVLGRLEEMGAEMTAIIELMTGSPPTAEDMATINFPD
ncbi:MAG TPA: hypothetical protein VFI91_11275 [Longimicrobiaceae bacterium]|nr:hypothetical protein [Longimicrobiaceae bacterium]